MKEYNSENLLLDDHRFNYQTAPALNPQHFYIVQ